MNNIKNTLKVVVLAVVLSVGLSYVYAWTAPTVAPTGGNVSTPVNVGATAQIKNGGLGVTNLAADSVTVGATANTGAITAPKFCIGTACITNWVSSVNGQVGDVTVASTATGLALDGYTSMPVNSTEDTYGAWGPETFGVWGDTLPDTCNGDGSFPYQCLPLEDNKICTDKVFRVNSSNVTAGCGDVCTYTLNSTIQQRPVTCNRATAYVKSAAPKVLSVAGLGAPGSSDIGFNPLNTCGQGGSYPAQSIPALTVKGPSSTYGGGTVIKENRSVVVEMSATLDYGFNLWVSRNGGAYQLATGLYHVAAGQGTMNDLVTYNLNLGATEYATFAHSAGQCWQNWYHSGSIKMTFPMQ